MSRYDSRCKSLQFVVWCVILPICLIHVKGGIHAVHGRNVSNARGGGRKIEAPSSNSQAAVTTKEDAGIQNRRFLAYSSQRIAEVDGSTEEYQSNQISEANLFGLPVAEPVPTAWKLISTDSCVLPYAYYSVVMAISKGVRWLEGNTLYMLYFYRGNSHD